MGFPLRIHRTTLGPTLENERPVTNPKRQPDAGVFNTAFWQLAGAGLCVPRAVVGMQIIAGPDIEVVGQLLAWDPNQSLALLDADRNGLGDYQLDFAATYPNENGASTALDLVWGEASVMGSNDKRAEVVRTSGISYRIRVRTGASGALVELVAGEILLFKGW